MQLLPVILERPFRHERGHCWRVRLPEAMGWATDTLDRPSISPLQLFENARPLGPGHGAHSDIANAGSGRFSVWRDCWLYFSTSDNTDPNGNGRVYSVDIGEGRGAIASPEDVTAAQIHAAARRKLDALFPREVLDFNGALAAAVADLDLVTSRFSGYRQDIEQSDAVFMSVMCAGRTWVRVFLQAYLEGVTGAAISLLPRSLERTPASPSICFSHDFLSLFETVPAKPWIVFEALMRERTLIVMTRDLRDLVVSWFFYLRRSQPENFARIIPGGTLAEFVDSPVVGLERLASVQILETAFFNDHPGPKISLGYEALQAAPRAEFERLLRFLSGGPIDAEAFELALRKSTFSEMQALEIQISRAGKAQEHGRLGVDNWSGDVNDLKVRSGKVGGYREFLPELADPATLAARYPITAKALGL